MAKGTEEDKKPEQTNLGDSGGLKRRLDELAIEAVVGSGYLEDHFVSNLKIVLGSLAIAVALLAQFYPAPYPDNWALLLACVAVYAALSAALNAFITYYEGHAILFTRPPRVGRGKALKLVSCMPRFSDQYTLAIAGKAMNAREVVSFEKSVAEYFDAAGHCDERRFTADVEALLERYAAKA